MYNFVFLCRSKSKRSEAIGDSARYSYATRHCYEKYAVVTKTIPIEEGPYCCVCYDSHTGLNISKCEE